MITESQKYVSFEDSHSTGIFFFGNIQVRGKFEYLKNVTQNFQKNGF